MTAEDRSWHIKRIQKELSEKADAERKQMGTMRR